MTLDGAVGGIGASAWGHKFQSYLAEELLGDAFSQCWMAGRQIVQQSAALIAHKDHV